MSAPDVLPCKLCGSGQTREAWHEAPYRVVWCPECDACFLLSSSLPQAGSLYTRDYFERFYLSDESRRAEFFRQQLGALGRLASPGAVLDVGCGVGLFLEVARADGWRCLGVEPSPFAAQYAREQRGLEVIASDLPSAELMEASFDLITFWDVLAHVPDPRQNILKARTLLRPGGLLVIKTPNRGRRAFRLAAILSHVVRSKGLVHVPAQLFHFTPKAIQTLVESCGLAVIHLALVHEPRPRVPGLRWSIRAFLAVRHGLRRLLGPKDSILLYAKAP